MHDLRERVLDAALPLLVDRGVHALTLADIATAARATESEVAALFPSAVAVANEAFRAWKGNLAQAILGDFPTTAEPREQFRVFWYRAADFARQVPYATIFLRRSAHAPWLDEHSRALDDQVHEMMVRMLKRWRAEKHVRDESPELLASFVLGAFDGIFQSSHRGHFPLTDDIVAAAERMVWDAVKRH